MNNFFENYEKLLAKVDDLCLRIETRFAKHLSCRSGCSSCCLSITVFPVEAHILKLALQDLSPDDVFFIRQNVKKNRYLDSCPLLFENRCLLYASRPIICRTHGLPIFYREDGIQKVDCCSHNQLSGLSITGADVIDLDTLNSLLVAVNTLYLTQIVEKKLPERMSIFDALLEEKP